MLTRTSVLLALLLCLPAAHAEPNRLPPPMASAGFAAPQFSASGATAEIGVVLDHPATSSVTVTCATTDLSARANVDYVPVRTALVFEPGEVSKSFAVAVKHRAPPRVRTLLLRVERVEGAAIANAGDLAQLFVRPPAAGPARAVLTEPKEGDELPGPTARFAWAAVPAARLYWLTVGTTPGGREVFDRPVTGATAVEVTGLPTDGRTVYVRLWTLLPAGWDVSVAALRACDPRGVCAPPAPPPPDAVIPQGLANPAVSTGPSAGGTSTGIGLQALPGWLIAATLVTPAPGTTLPGASATFTWAAVPWAQSYAVEVLSSGASLGTVEAGTATSATVTNLPADGRALTIRLWSRFAGMALSYDHAYTAGTTSAAAFVQRNLAGVNAYRASKGAAPLVLDAQLSRFAEAGTAQLVVDHKPHQHFIDAINAGTLFTTDGFRGSAAENQGDPNGWTVLHADPTTNTNLQIDAILKAMFDEGPGGGHYENMIATRFTRIGIGLSSVNGRLYLTNDFSQ